MIAILLCILFGAGESSPRVDVVELNTYGTGQQQIIVRKWQRLAVGSSHYCTDWRNLSPDDGVVVRRLGNHYVVRFRSHGTDYEIHCRSYRETRTVKDPELSERKILPEDNRTHQLR